MTFDLLHRLVTASTSLCGLLVIYFSGEFPLLVIFLAGLVFAFGPFLRPLFSSRWQNRVLTGLVVVAAPVAIYFAISTGNYLYFAILYALFLSAVRSLSLHTSAEFMQAYVLSFLLVIASAVINPGLSFGVILFLYLLSLTLALLLTTVRREAEAGALSSPTPQGPSYEDFLARKDLIPAGFVALTILVTTAVFLMSVVFFFLFPRIGLGFFASQSRPGVALSGFSDTVTLGEIGEVLEDPEIVARVRFLEGSFGPPLRLRGQSLDTYDGHSWSKTTKRMWELRMDHLGRHLVDPSGISPDSEGVVAYEVYLEPLRTQRRIMFGLSMPVAFKRPSEALEALRPEKWRFGRDIAGDIYVSGPPNVALQYTAYSYVKSPDAALLRSAPETYPEWVRDLYLQLPPLDERIRDLARRVTERAKNAYEKALAVEKYLQSEYEYALNSRHEGPDPLADFLFANKRGHCEYFASSMVVMLRSIGVPARIVTGFYGGEMNEYGGYVALRKADAHSWVEVYFPGHGFVTFDPTPPAALESRQKQPFMQSIGAILDAIRLFWYRWVIEYNLDKQVEFIVGLLRPSLKPSPGGFKLRDLRRLKEELKGASIKPYVLVFGGLLGAVALAFVLARFWHRKGGAKIGDPSHPAVRAYKDFVRIAKRYGLARSASETQLAFAKRVSERYPEAEEAIYGITWAYLRAVFSGSVDGEDKERLREWVERFRLVAKGH